MSASGRARAGPHPHPSVEAPDRLDRPGGAPDLPHFGHEPRAAEAVPASDACAAMWGKCPGDAPDRVRLEAPEGGVVQKGPPPRARGPRRGARQVGPLFEPRVQVLHGAARPRRVVPIRVAERPERLQVLAERIVVVVRRAPVVFAIRVDVFGNVVIRGAQAFQYSVDGGWRVETVLSLANAPLHRCRLICVSWEELGIRVSIESRHLSRTTHDTVTPNLTVS
jgi:hypothetical protein